MPDISASPNRSIILLEGRESPKAAWPPMQKKEAASNDGLFLDFAAFREN
jgi:hypothetical protein